MSLENKNTMEAVHQGMTCSRYVIFGFVFCVLPKFQRETSRYSIGSDLRFSSVYSSGRKTRHQQEDRKKGKGEVVQLGGGVC